MSQIHWDFLRSRPRYAPPALPHGPSVYIEYYDSHLKGGAEIFRLPHYGRIAREDCSYVAEVARISARHFKVHLAVTSVGHGVFKGVMKCRKIPEKKKEEKGGLLKAAKRLRLWMFVGIQAYATAICDCDNGEIV
jgi:hypothetical protein